MKKKHYLWIIPLALILILFSIRALTPTEIDDVHPDIWCDQEYLEKVDILWVVPNYNGQPIMRNQTWCNQILLMNKTLGVHGYTHTYQEFEIQNLTEEDINKAMFLFENCFDQRPLMFKPPQLDINKHNEKLIEEAGMELRGMLHQILHKVYHCNDTLEPIKNKWIDYF